MCTTLFVRLLKYLVVVAFVCAAYIGAGVWAGAQGFTVSVNDARPLAAVVANLEDRFGWVVTYEDPPYVYARDIQDVTQSVRRTFRPGQKPVLVPNGGPFTFVAPPQIDPSAPQEPEVLQALLEQYATSGYAGRFVLERTGSVFHVVGRGTRDNGGAWVPSSPILDWRLTQPSRTTTALVAIQELIAQTNGRLALGTSPMGLLQQASVSQDAASDTARNLLLRTLEATGRPLSWRVLCDPGNTNPCVLNIRLVGLAIQGK